MTLRIGSLCSGYEGLGMAVQRVLGGELAWVSDIDKGANKILAHRYPDVPNLGDFTLTDWATVEPVDVLVAGYPCQPFSGNGPRSGADDERHLWPHVFRAIRCLRPRITFLENVEDHLTLGFGSVLTDLASAGFDAEWCVLRASDVGAPHGRPRLFIAASDTSGFLSAREEPRRLGAAVRSASTLARAERVDGDGTSESDDEGSDDRGGVGGPWGPFTPAVRHWEGVLGRPAPPHVVQRPGLADDIDMRFVEWSMGLPAGWVTDVPGLTTGQMAHALGNGVVPQQAEAALRYLLTISEAAA